MVHRSLYIPDFCLHKKNNNPVVIGKACQSRLQNLSRLHLPLVWPFQSPSPLADCHCFPAMTALLQAILQSSSHTVLPEFLEQQALPASGPLHVASLSLEHRPHFHLYSLHGRLFLILLISAPAAQRDLPDHPTHLSLSTRCVSFIALGTL